MSITFIHQGISQVRYRGRGVVSTSFYLKTAVINNNSGVIILYNRLKVLTNNSLVTEKYCNDLHIVYVEGQYIDVLKSVRDMVHKGSKLITHPLMGSVKPNETIFRSIIVSEGEVLDYESLAIIENSIATAERFIKNSKVPDWKENILDDFRFVDLKLFESALDSIIK